ncbi:hypothetical protein SARC_05507 [Sphaeroforma arctica JP610]|uniref:Thioredoxin domain-containing protein n=1 Tax=Sphaeroforma arctica JP610 TaxID=667725 RepID=A0A0L0G035_9EUKA|nr:hypothetical protein SARC_05507 [Sphaeroforma arctica JP610]KNC82209.1 hypothetical protein SARC_05507 [Sphaeroforma arctica JP610]|eukprot:XP_014156111.1 hypothetical protein SARC_05507 [Sphaeroforma arctica JP610]
MSDEYVSKGVRFYKVDVDEVRSVASAEGVSAMPTFKVYREGACVGSVRGFNQQELVRVIDEILLGTSKVHERFVYPIVDR